MLQRIVRRFSILRVFLGLPGNDARADMRVVDIYRRDGDKLAENWVFIDLLHWLSMQGLDVLKRLPSVK